MSRKKAEIPAVMEKIPENAKILHFTKGGHEVDFNE